MAGLSGALAVSLGAYGAHGEDGFDAGLFSIPCHFFVHRIECPGRAKDGVHTGEQVPLYPHTGDARSPDDALSECDRIAAGAGDFGLQWHLLLPRSQWRQTSRSTHSLRRNGSHLRLDFDDALR